jgi:hypothetical protein
MCYLVENDERGLRGELRWEPMLVPQAVLNEKTEDVVADAVEQKGAKDVVLHVFGTEQWCVPAFLPLQPSFGHCCLSSPANVIII